MENKRSSESNESHPLAAEATCRIDEAHAVQLARHLSDMYKRRRFTDLKEPHSLTAH
jgi:hypothetical protein